MNRVSPGQVRIIAGSLRGSRLPVEKQAGLRPTSDRVRETLFNWLQNQVAGKRVLDLYAGTGALGFEAASRGADEVVLVERDPQLAASLRASAQRLQVARLRVECADALAWLARPPERCFDLAFIDPPFAAELWAVTATALSPWLRAGAWIYLESAAAATFALPSDWRLQREGRTREVRFALYRADSGQA